MENEAPLKSAYKFDYKDWTAVHQSDWTKLMGLFFSGDCPYTFVEVGCFEGRSTLFFADYLTHPESKMFCIDTWEGGEETERKKLDFDFKQIKSNFDTNITLHPNRQRIITLQGRSEEKLLGLGRNHFKDVDFIYLDGSHTRRDVLVDLTLAMLLVKPGGVILVDDYKNNMATDDGSLQPRLAVDFVAHSFVKDVVTFVTPNNQFLILRNPDNG